VWPHSCSGLRRKIIVARVYGRLQVVATPIGNLADLSERARAALAAADLIAAEDTRHTGALLKAAGIAASFNANPDIFKGPSKPNSLVAGGFQIALFAWVGSPFIAGTPPIYESPAGAGTVQQNYSRAGTTQIDTMLKQWLTETDSSKVASIGNQIDKLLWDQMATLPLYQKPTFIAWTNNVKGVQDNPTLQGRRFDPSGDYVRRWVPELAGLPEEAGDGPTNCTPWAVRQLVAQGISGGGSFRVAVERGLAGQTEPAVPDATR